MTDSPPLTYIPKCVAATSSAFLTFYYSRHHSLPFLHQVQLLLFMSSYVYSLLEKEMDVSINLERELFFKDLIGLPCHKDVSKKKKTINAELLIQSTPSLQKQVHIGLDCC